MAIDDLEIIKQQISEAVMGFDYPKLSDMADKSPAIMDDEEKDAYALKLSNAIDMYDDFGRRLVKLQTDKKGAGYAILLKRALEEMDVDAGVDLDSYKGLSFDSPIVQDIIKKLREKNKGKEFNEAIAKFCKDVEGLVVDGPEVSEKIKEIEGEYNRLIMAGFELTEIYECDKRDSSQPSPVSVFYCRENHLFKIRMVDFTKQINQYLGEVNISGNDAEGALAGSIEFMKSQLDCRDYDFYLVQNPIRSANINIDNLFEQAIKVMQERYEFMAGGDRSRCN